MKNWITKHKPPRKKVTRKIKAWAIVNKDFFVIHTVDASEAFIRERFEELITKRLYKIVPCKITYEV